MIEVEGRHENRIAGQLAEAARRAAMAAGDTCVLCSMNEPTAERYQELKVPSFVRQGRREHMGVIW